MRRMVHGLAALTLAFTAFVTTAGQVGAVPVVTGVLWDQAQAPPSGTMSGGGELNDLACPTDETCFAVGYRYEDDELNRYATVSQSTNGVWGPMQAVGIGGLPLTSPPNTALGAVSCTSVDECMAAGVFDLTADDAGIPRAFAIPRVSGAWGSAVAIDTSALPGTVTRVIPWSIDCSSAGACTMTGAFYTSAPGNPHFAFTASSTSGVWGPARAVTFAGGAAADPAGSSESWAVSCPADGNCTVVGSYTKTGGGIRAFAASSSSGTWADAEEIALPAGAATDPDVVAVNYRRTLACSAVRVCTMIANYKVAGSTRREAFTASSTGGGFAPAERITFPSGLSRNGAWVAGLSCVDADNCVAGGFVVLAGCWSAGNCLLAPFAVIRTGGSWGIAERLNTTDEVAVAPLSGGFDVSCFVSTDNCALVGTFLDTAGVYSSLAATRTGGQWSFARRVAGPGNPGQPDLDVELFRVECTAYARCSAVGYQEDDTGFTMGVAVNAWPMPSAPGGLSLTTTPNSRTVTVSWTPPGPAIGAPSGPSPRPPAPVGPQPESYQVRCETGSGDPVFVGATASPARVTLPAGATARCGVRARYGSAVPDNSFLGDWFEGPLGWTNTVTVPASVPDAPTSVGAAAPVQPSGRTTNVTFTLPPNVSGAPVTAVEARCTSSDGGTTRTTTGLTSPLVVADLTAGRTYRCTVRAANRVGSSGWVTTNQIVVPAGPPTGVRVAPNGRYGAVTVMFTRPDGGPPPSNYRIRCASTDGGTTRTLVKNAAPFVVEGLTKGRTYRCTVNAVFGSTAGPVSDPSPTIAIP